MAYRQFIVIRKPKQRYTDVYRVAVMVVEAQSKAQALREAERADPEWFPNTSTETHRKPDAMPLEMCKTYAA